MAAGAPPEQHAPTEPMADPFPSLGEPEREPEPERTRTPARNVRPDVSSQDAFPTLGAAAPRSMPKTWVSRVPVIQRVTHQESLTLTLADEQLQRLSDVLKRIHDKFPGVSVEASTTRRTGATIFIIKGPRDAVVDSVRRELAVQLARRVSLTVPVPASLRAHVIGPGGRNVRAITEETGVRITVPHRAGGGGGGGGGAQPPQSDVSDPLLDEPLAAVIEGDEVNARRAEARIRALVAERTSKITQRITHIDAMLYPFIAGARGANVRALAAEAGDVSITVPAHGAIVVAGERDAVVRAARALDERAAELARTLRTLTTSIPRRQHQFLTGASALDILAATQCSIELPAEGDSVTIRGPQTQLPSGLTAAIEKADSMRIEVVDVGAHGGAHAARVLAWLAGRVPHTPGVQVHLPGAGSTHIELVGADAAKVGGAREHVEALVRSAAPERMRVVDVDPLVLRSLAAKRGAALRPLDARGVDVVMPADDRADVLLVAAREHADLGEAAAELARIAAAAAAAADIHTEVLAVPAAQHAALIGPERTVLNALVGEDRAATLAFGTDAPVPPALRAELTPDSVVVRGTRAAVARAAARIRSLAAAGDGAADAPATEEFDVDAALVPHLIGRGGAVLTRLREQLGVRVQVDDPETRGRGPVHVVVTGRGPCAAEARERLQARAARAADETTLVIKVPRALQGALIGQGGKYVTRLQDKYEVHIAFPPAASSSEDVSIRGGRRGAAAARTELLELMQYEQEHNHEDELVVPRDVLARILGRGGTRVNEIRADTGALIDVAESSAARRAGEAARLRLRGTQDAVAAARRTIGAIVAELEDTRTLELRIPWRLHGTLIGARGQHIREICARAGSPNANIARFPPAGTQDDLVVLRGPSAVTERVAAELEREARALLDRVVLGAAAPPRVHRTLIARGGRRDSEWQTTHRTVVIVPGWREYAELGEPANAAELGDADPASIVKVHGPADGAAAVVRAIADVVAADDARAPRRTAAAPRIDAA